MKVKVVSSQLWQSTLAVAPLYLSVWPDRGHSWSSASCPPGILACPRHTPGVSGCCSLCWPRRRWSRGCSRSRWPRPASARCLSPREGHRPWCVGCDAGTIYLWLSVNDIVTDVLCVRQFTLTSISIIPLSSLIFFVENFVWAPAPFHSPVWRKNYSTRTKQPRQK